MTRDKRETRHPWADTKPINFGEGKARCCGAPKTHHTPDQCYGRGIIHCHICAQPQAKHAILDFCQSPYVPPDGVKEKI